MSPVVKNGPASYTVPGRMTLEPPRSRYMSFWSSNCQHKVHWARFGWEMGCIKFSAIVSQQLVDRFQPFFWGVGNRFENVPCKSSRKFALAHGLFGHTGGVRFIRPLN